MPAYLIAEIRVEDATLFEQYRRGVADTLESAGARYIVRGGEAQLLEGKPEPARLVVVEFPDARSARDWWDSEAYQPLKELRRRASSARIVLAEGM